MSTNYRAMKFPLDTARSGAVQTVQGGYIVATDASSTSAYVDIALDDGAGVSDYVRLKKGDKLEYGKGFEKIYVNNPAQPGEYVTLTIAASREVFDYQTTAGQNIDSINNPVVTKGGNTLAHAAVTITTSATLILAAVSSTTGWVFKNNGAVTIYLGGASVTTGNGYPLAPGESIGWDLSDALYGIVASGTADLRYMKGSKV